MQPRLDANKIAPDAFKALANLQAYVDGSGIDRAVLDLAKIRTSQINGCAFCIAMHIRDARAAGESDERIHLLDAWREAPGFSPRERAALAWIEAVTLITDGHVPDNVFEEAKREFSELELVNLTYAVMAMNAWNRLAISFRKRPPTPAPHTGKNA